MIIILVVVFAACTLLLLFSIHWKQKYSYTAKLINAFPSAESFTPIIGQIVHFSRKQNELFQQFQNMAGKFNETFSFWAGPYPFLIVKTEDDAEIILSNIKHIQKGIIYRILTLWLNKGLLTSTGNKWHKRRKMLTPAFHYNILQMFIEVFGEQCDNLKMKLKEECGKPKTDITPIIKMTTLLAICETSLGVKMDQNDSSLSRYYDNVCKAGEIFMERVLKPWQYNDSFYTIFPLCWSEKKVVNELHKFTSDIIESKEKIFCEENVTNLETTDNGIKKKKRLALLDLLLHAKHHLGQIDDEGIREEVDTFVFEGHDTTAIGITFALLLVANHKDVQEKIVEELNEIFGDSDRYPTYEDLQNMKYLECCLKESLRLYPSVPIITRILQEDTQLTHHVAPGGSEISLFIYNIHRNPKNFPDPEKFDPDRFLPENCKGRHPYAYIPFSAGPRNCIGQKFAMLELKSIMSSVLRNFIMEPVDTTQNVKILLDVVLRVEGPVNIKFTPRC